MSGTIAAEDETRPLKVATKYLQYAQVAAIAIIATVVLVGDVIWHE